MKEFKINPTTIFHVLRHFKAVSLEYRRDLIGKEYYYFDFSTNSFVKSIIDLESITQGLSTIGSKFNDYFSSPDEVLRFAKQKFEEMSFENKIKWQQGDSNKSRATTLVIPTKTIGVRNLYPLNQFRDAHIKQVPRSLNPSDKQNLVNIVVLETIKLMKAQELIVEITETSDLEFLWVSCYPNSVKRDAKFGSLNEMVFVNP
jgi:hypothetical protein